MDITSIIELLDKNKLKEIANLYKVDKKNHKITGEFILKSFVLSILKGRSISLRFIEALTNNNEHISTLLKSKNECNKTIDHSSIGKRLSKIEVKYFRYIYEDLVLKYDKKFSQQQIDKFARFDSTIITLSGKLLKDGLNLGGKPEDRHIKFSASLKSSIPSSVRICTQASEISEDVALKRAIDEARVNKESILLFDRGIAKADTFNEFTKSKQYFITRLNVGRKYVLLRDHKHIEDKNSTVPNNNDKDDITNIEIISDKIVNLYNKDKKQFTSELRLIKAKNDQGAELWFLTNVNYLTSQQVCASYTRRRDIEVFFRFIKQNLQCKHFISNNINGMSAYLYSVLITAILFIIYKISNELKGYKIALFQFMLSVEKSIIKDIVKYCGGSPELVDHKLFSP